MCADRLRYLSKSTRSGKDQNANTEMAKAVEGAETIARAVGGFALIVHHTTKAARHHAAVMRWDVTGCTHPA